MGRVTCRPTAAAHVSAATSPSRVVTGPGWNPSFKWQASKYTWSGRLNVMKPMASSGL